MRHTTRENARAGFSLVELLLVVAIIAILMAIALPTYGRAMHKAKDTAGQEAMRQKRIAKDADSANSVQFAVFDQDRPKARTAFYQVMDTGKEDRYITEVLYVVKNDNEFRAYFHTLIDYEGYAGDLEFVDGGALVAYDPQGRKYILPPVNSKQAGGYPAYWDLVTVSAAYMSVLPHAISVSYSDGHVEKVRYPETFPATPTVAKLTQRFIEYEP